MTASEAGDRLGLEVPPEGTHVLFVGTDDDGVAVTGDLDFLQRFTTEIGDPSAPRRTTPARSSGCDKWCLRQRTPPEACRSSVWRRPKISTPRWGSRR
ncbi:hypothetical protein [Pseudonocardia parietis]|uniref:Uncharacterized protein n=1 Tax=Pseudonocardia parietis TaxID=570936 RepID=A0ABS4W648_9PSEU|nr:hypothetical protein [Pseudonocardia parietis]MBP2371687.1 hypothetical protein [Pseudonocardia parietis]